MVELLTRWYVVKPEAPEKYKHPGHQIDPAMGWNLEFTRNHFKKSYTTHRGTIICINGKRYPV